MRFSLQSWNDSVHRLRTNKKPHRRSRKLCSLLEALEQRILFTTAPSTVPYWQTIMPNQLPDGGQLAKQNSPVLLTIDDGLATNNFNNPLKPIYDSRALGKSVMVVPIDIPNPSTVYLPDPDSPGDGNATGYMTDPIDTDYSFTVTLTAGGVTIGEHTFTTTGEYETVEVAFPINASSLPTGRYNLHTNVSFPDPELDYDASASEDPAGVINVINRTDDPSTSVFHSEFGSGWTLPGLDRLVIQPGTSDQPAGVLYVGGDDQVTWFAGTPGTDQTLDRAPGPFNFDTLTEQANGTDGDLSDDTYTLTDPSGTIEVFDANGLLQARTDRNGNVVDTYSYTNADGGSFADDIYTIQDDVGRTTTFNYAGSSKVVTSIEDFAGRVTTLAARFICPAYKHR